ncbi:glycosyltransferase family 4 protein [Chitinispirillales bacterium ANBcel5]|uniref:glycosyltransferase family 4 protein n=1 Tax=Cellulosispirillum alkaliphilum TaxID=3039283 RepID=UPI002A583056|nr:glycosyltransferase family 4 protein [Chitinispirillales bacterium ANBcel5]
MFRIAHFIYDNEKNPWLGGGGFYRTVELYKRFPENFRIDIYCASFVGSENYAINKRVQVIFLGKKKKSYLLSRLQYSSEAKKMLKRTRSLYDVVIEDFSPYSPLFSFKYITSGKLISILQNYYGASIHLKKFGPAGLIPFIFEKYCISHFNGNTLFSSQDLMNIISKKCALNPSNPMVVENGVEEEFFTTPKEEKDPQTVLFLGRIEIFQKGIDILLQQFSILVKHNPEVRLIIAGSGKDSEKVKSRIKWHKIDDNTEFLGRVERKELPSLISSCSLTVVPSRYESWGMVSLESQACQTPVVARNIPGLRQTVVHEKTGFLFETPNQMSQYIAILLRERNNRRAMGEEGRRFAQNYSWYKLAQKKAKYIDHVINS